MISQLFDFIQCCPTASHTAATVRAMLVQAGFTQLLETQPWELVPGGKYYVTRGMSALIAFRVPKRDFHAFSVVAPHGDSPCFKVKERPEMAVDGQYTKLNTEVYGGMQLALWTDRPLSVAGRLAVRADNGVKGVLCDIRRDLLVIPGVAIHMNRAVNDGVKLDPQKDTLPLLGAAGCDLKALVAENAGVAPEDILAWDLYLYSRERPAVLGARGEYIAAPRLDDLECAFAGITAFLAAQNPENVTVFSLFDNEETGSLTRQGADSPFLWETLERVALSCDKTREELLRAVAGGFMLSADNAHAVHPDSPDKADPTNRCYLNGGVVVKHSPRYASDALTAGVFQRVCEKAGVPVQVYYNHSKIPGGGTLGNLSGSHVSLPTVDVGLPQLSMHSPWETAGAEDLPHMVWAMRAFYETVLTQSGRDEWLLS